jgi:hypothetical protein
MCMQCRIQCVTEARDAWLQRCRWRILFYCRSHLSWRWCRRSYKSCFGRFTGETCTGGIFRTRSKVKHFHKRLAFCQTNAYASSLHFHVNWEILWNVNSSQSLQELDETVCLTLSTAYAVHICIRLRTQNKFVFQWIDWSTSLEAIKRTSQWTPHHAP